MAYTYFNRDSIQQEYLRRISQANDKRWGWSFMYVPEACLKRAKVMLIGLNPGGSEVDPAPEWDSPYDNAYVDEAWAGYEAGEYPLQKQVKLLFEALEVDAKDVFSANFVPFRSPTWADLHDPKGAIAFSRNLWTEVLDNSPARLFMSLGKAAGQQVAAVLGATYQSSHLVGWGKHKIDVYRNDRNQIVLALPHLSRFRIFGNGRTQAAEVVKTAAREAGL